MTVKNINQIKDQFPLMYQSILEIANKAKKDFESENKFIF